jgi:DNA mismatch repair ATPase MutS
VVTGPNQGGKTTVARSMGQAVYFALMGLPVNAEEFNMPMFNGISTHFEAEESLQSNSGKLKEEINRLLPMMRKDSNRNSFVVLNELFTTATTHDAMIMGRKVMESFLARECYGIYVTHIQELAEEADNIISLVAQLEPGEESKRSYRMLPMKAQGYGYSDALVKKFHLEYEEIVRRLS